MKRSNHKHEKGAKPVYSTCRACGLDLPSKFAAKNHVCKGER
jgi:hypothetical protein